MILAAARVSSGVRHAEGVGAIIAGVAGLVSALALWAGAGGRRRWALRLGVAHALLASLLAIPGFIVSWTPDAKVTAVLWFGYAVVALFTLLRHLRHPSLPVHAS